MRAEIPDRWDEACTDVVPVLRSSTAPANALALAADNPRHAPIRRPVAPFLDLLLALDRPAYKVYLTPQHLERWQVSSDAVFSAASSRLDVAHGLHRRDDGLWRLDSEDGYAASRLILPGWLAAFRGRVHGAPVAVVPHAREVLVGGSEDSDQLVTLIDHAVRGWRHGGEPISPMVYTLDAFARLTVFEPEDRTHPVAEAMLRATARAFAESEYQRQQAALADVYDECWSDLEVGLGPPGADGRQRAFSFCRWKRGERPLLPEADYLVFADATAEPMLAVAWSTLRSLELLQRAPIPGPDRWKPARWPNAAEGERLRAAAVSPDAFG
jgi:hypothetical protein